MGRTEARLHLQRKRRYLLRRQAHVYCRQDSEAEAGAEAESGHRRQTNAATPLSFTDGDASVLSALYHYCNLIEHVPAGGIFGVECLFVIFTSALAIVYTLITGML